MDPRETEEREARGTGGKRRREEKEEESRSRVGVTCVNVTVKPGSSILGEHIVITAQAA
jgi:hypothetical protein